ncbi:hypothetical protein FCV25MIE_15760 [Fagus crenata]
MNCIVWNCRGLGNPRTVQELAQMVRDKDPSAVFLIETWANEPQLELLRIQLHFANKLVVPRRNRGGGLAAFWKQDTDLTISSYSYSHIDTIIDGQTDDAWRFTCFYGAPKMHRRIQSWNLLRSLYSQSTIPWCCAGDFNEIIRLEEKQGQVLQPDTQMQAFREVLDDYGFCDLGYTGAPFTWCNNRFSGPTVWERLDRAVASPSWITRFPHAGIHHLDYIGSDHKALWINPTESPIGSVKKPFKFKEMWLSEEECSKTIAAAWQATSKGNAMFQVLSKLKLCKNQLKSWSRSSFGSVRKKLEAKRVELNQAEAQSMRGAPSDRIPVIRRELESLLSKEERMWKQRSRTQWLQHGDRNTSFFHGCATNRHRRNKIMGLRNNNGEWHSNPTQVQTMLISYFQDLFQTSNPCSIDSMLQCVPSVVTDSMNETLTRPYTAMEVNVALKQMKPMTAPGADGLPPFFYQSQWSVIGEDVTRGVLSCLNSGKLIRSINHTNITLIPKVKSPEKVTDYRPISLCNVLYKIISKVVAKPA